MDIDPPSSPIHFLTTPVNDIAPEPFTHPEIWMPHEDSDLEAYLDAKNLDATLGFQAEGNEFDNFVLGAYDYSLKSEGGCF